MDVNEIKENLSKTTMQLLEIASDICNNSISYNIEYIVRKLNPQEEDNKKELKKFIKKKHINIDELSKLIHNEKESISWIDSQILLSEYDRTLLLVTLVKKIQTKKLQDQEIMFHCAVALPPYFNNKDKFDVNWQIL